MMIFQKFKQAFEGIARFHFWPKAAPDCCMVWSAAAGHRRGNQPVAWTAAPLCDSW